MTVIAAASECIAASKPSTTLQLCLPCKCLIRLDLVVRSRSSQGLVYLWPVGGLLLTVEALWYEISQLILRLCLPWIYESHLGKPQCIAAGFRTAQNAMS
jgi:hypothetical protein